MKVDRTKMCILIYQSLEYTTTRFKIEKKTHTNFLAHPLPSPGLPSSSTPDSPHLYTAVAAFAANHAENACAFRVCINTVPGPVNLHTRPSPAIILDTMPPEATRSRTYLQFQATRWPLSMMYFSSFCSCGGRRR